MSKIVTRIKSPRLSRPVADPVARAVALERHGQVKEAVELLERLSREGHPRAGLHLARCLLRLGKVQRAAQVWQSVQPAALSPADRSIYDRLGMLCGRLTTGSDLVTLLQTDDPTGAQAAAALDHLRADSATDPRLIRMVEAWQAAARGLTREAANLLADLAPAAAALLQLKNGRPSSVAVLPPRWRGPGHALEGCHRVAMGDVPGALSAFSKAWEEGEKGWAAAMNLALSMAAAGRDARPWWKRAVERMPVDDVRFVFRYLRDRNQTDLLPMEALEAVAVRWPAEPGLCEHVLLHLVDNEKFRAAEAVLAAWNPKTSGEAVEKADLLLATLHHEEALRLLADQVEEHPELVERICTALRDWIDEADPDDSTREPVLDVLLKRCPTSSPIWRLAGDWAYWQDRNDVALRRWEQVVTLSSSPDRERLEIGQWLLEEADDLPLAMRWLKPLRKKLARLEAAERRLAESMFRYLGWS